MPTEAEWEFAARGGNASRGFQFAGSNDINQVAWYEGNSRLETHPVAQLAPNELGLYDFSFSFCIALALHYF
ncbi:MAG: SUMF1/EgtB/PvdO family nonheme iron enzyme [Bacteroidales bacterium]|nr:SUMF1/EgtB/PvdO family nonheme iron enzyme [Bacteroidales bacterium]